MIYLKRKAEGPPDEMLSAKRPHLSADPVKQEGEGEQEGEVEQEAEQEDVKEEVKEVVKDPRIARVAPCPNTAKSGTCSGDFWETKKPF